MSVSDPLAAVARAGGEALLGRLQRLDAPRPSPAPMPTCGGPAAGASTDFDVVLVGGGLSLLYAPLLAQQGLKVAVCDADACGTAQREWNASAAELQQLVDCDLLTQDTLATLIINRYRHGICRWHGGSTQRVFGVLDCAIDATALLAHARGRAQQLGVTLFDQHTCVAVQPGGGGVRLNLLSAAGAHKILTARLLLDGRGAQSPHATADLVCPTVGGVMEGLDFAADVGDILVTTEDVEAGQQHIWEAFPGRPGQLTVYLFYYTPRAALQPGALQALYARFFARLGGFKSGRAQLRRPTFGLIPGWSRLVPAPRAPHPRIVLLGDAAARHSPLTFCGFGATLRSLGPACAAILQFLRADGHNRGRGPGACVVHDTALHGATGALAQLLASPAGLPPAALNALLDAAFNSLASMGNEAFAALLQDRLPLPQFIAFLRQTSRVHPAVWGLVGRKLGVWQLCRWSARLAGQLMWQSLPAPRLRHLRAPS